MRSAIFNKNNTELEKACNDFINNTKKTYGYLPTRQEISNHFLETKGIRYDNQIDNYVNKTKNKIE